MKVVEKIKRFFMLNNVFSKVMPLMRYVEKYFRAG